MGNWYDYDKKSKQALTILMERAKRPTILISGKLVELSLITFSMVFIFFNTSAHFSVCYVLDIKTFLLFIGSFRKLQYRIKLELQ